MKFKITVEDNIDVKGLASQIENNKDFNIYMAKEWHNLIKPWIPMDTGNLSENVEFTEQGEIQYNAPYAKYVYNGEGKNFNKKHHPLATAKWDEAARPSEEDKLIQKLQAYIDAGRLNLK